MVLSHFTFQLSREAAKPDLWEFKWEREAHRSPLEKSMLHCHAGVDMLGFGGLARWRWQAARLEWRPTR